MRLENNSCMQFVHTSLSIFANAKKVGQNNKTINLQLTLCFVGKNLVEIDREWFVLLF